MGLGVLVEFPFTGETTNDPSDSTERGCFIRRACDDAIDEFNMEVVVDQLLAATKLQMKSQYYKLFRLRLCRKCFNLRLLFGEIGTCK